MIAIHLLYSTVAVVKVLAIPVPIMHSASTRLSSRLTLKDLATSFSSRIIMLRLYMETKKGKEEI